jgi:hypothetical protein
VVRAVARVRSYSIVRGCLTCSPKQWGMRPGWPMLKLGKALLQRRLVVEGNQAPQVELGARQVRAGPAQNWARRQAGNSGSQHPRKAADGAARGCR